MCVAYVRSHAKKNNTKKKIAIVKLSLFVAWFWPLPQDANKRKVLCMQLYQYISILLTIAVIASMVYGLVKNLDDPELVIKASLGLFPCTTGSHVIWNILCRLVIYQRLQVINRNIIF